MQLKIIFLNKIRMNIRINHSAMDNQKNKKIIKLKHKKEDWIN